MDAEPTVCVSDLIKTKTIEKLPKDEHSKSCYRKYSSYHGLLYAALSGVFLQLSSVIVKYIQNISPGELAVVRYAAILCFSLPLAIYSRKDVFGPIKSFHVQVIRGLLGAMSSFLNFVAFRYLPLGEASVIIFCSPVLVSVFGKIFLKEPCGLLQSFAIFSSAVGLILIAKPPFIGFEITSIYNKGYAYGIGAAIGSLITVAVIYTLSRKLSVIHYSVLLFNMGWIGTIESAVLVIATDKFRMPTCGVDQWLVILLGISGFFGTLCLFFSLEIENVGPVCIVRGSTDILLAFFWQLLFFKEIPDKYSISGAVLVTFSALLINMQKWITSKKK